MACGIKPNNPLWIPGQDLPTLHIIEPNKEEGRWPFVTKTREPLILTFHMPGLLP